jgi:pimeloyl-ACP methyl ester carboxylesterase
LKLNSLQLNGSGESRSIDPVADANRKSMNREVNFIKLPDGRRLAYAEYGDPQGMPAIYCHGFPGTRLEARLFDMPARRFKLRVIAPDRNGLGLSDPKPERKLLDWTADVEALADSLGFERFFLIGVSGGGPYATACAYRLADRLNGVTLVCPLGPLDQPGLLAAMRWPAKINFQSIRNTPLLSHLSFQYAVVPMVQLSPLWIYQLMLSIAPAPDAAVLKRPGVRSAITASIHESVRQGAKGVLQEMEIYTRPWGFNLAEVAIPIQIWHGTADETVPILHSQTLAAELADCSLQLAEEEGHFSLPIDHMDKIQQQLIANRLDQPVSP